MKCIDILLDSAQYKHSQRHHINFQIIQYTHPQAPACHTPSTAAPDGHLVINRLQGTISYSATLPDNFINVSRKEDEVMNTHQRRRDRQLQQNKHGGQKRQDLYSKKRNKRRHQTDKERKTDNTRNKIDKSHDICE